MTAWHLLPCHSVQLKTAINPLKGWEGGNNILSWHLQQRTEFDQPCPKLSCYLNHHQWQPCKPLGALFHRPLTHSHLLFPRHFHLAGHGWFHLRLQVESKNPHETCCHQQPPQLHRYHPRGRQTDRKWTLPHPFIVRCFLKSVQKVTWKNQLLLPQTEPIFLSSHFTPKP